MEEINEYYLSHPTLYIKLFTCHPNCIICFLRTGLSGLLVSLYPQHLLNARDILYVQPIWFNIWFLYTSLSSFLAVKKESFLTVFVYLSQVHTNWPHSQRAPNKCCKVLYLNRYVFFYVYLYVYLTIQDVWCVHECIDTSWIGQEILMYS